MKRHPMWALAAGAALVVLLEIGRVEAGGRDYAWLIAEAAVAGAALFVAWRGQERLRLLPLLVLAAVLPRRARLVAHRGGHPRRLRRLDLHEPGAVAARRRLPALGVPDGRRLAVRARDVAGRRLGADAERAAHDPVPARGRRRRLVAADAVERVARGARRPLAAEPYAWEFKFDLVPAALLAVGLALAYRERFGLAGIVLGVGAAVKWTPALAALALLVWLLASRRTREGVAARRGLRRRLRGTDAPVPGLGSRRRARRRTRSRVGGRSPASRCRTCRCTGSARRSSARTSRTRPSCRTGPIRRPPSSSCSSPRRARDRLARAWAPGGGSGRGRDRARGVPAHEPDLQLAVPRRAARGVGRGDRAARPQLGASSSCSGAAAAAASLFNAFVYPFVLPGPSGIWEPVSALMFAVALPLTGWLLLTAARARDYASPS